jgi:Male sterility protein
MIFLRRNGTPAHAYGIAPPAVRPISLICIKSQELLRNAVRAGLPVAIYRPLDITGDDRTGAWNTATEMYALVRFITDAGVAPDIDLPLGFVPADICAAAITHISAHSPPGIPTTWPARAGHRWDP